MNAAMKIWLIVACLFILYILLPQAKVFAAERQAGLVQQQAALAKGKYAIVIGINNYQSDAIVDLRYSEADAKAFANVLISKCGYPQSHITTLLGKDATWEAVSTRLHSLSNPQLYPDADTIIFYFSGHGVAHDGVNYLLPYDGTAQFMDQNLSLDYMVEQLNQSQFSRQVLFIDACRKRLTGNERSLTGVGFTSPQLISEVARGTKIMFGAEFGEVSREDDALGHGLFTQALIEGLGGKAAGYDGFIRVSNLEEYVLEYMAEYSRKYPERKQIPVTAGEGSGAIELALIKPRELPAYVNQVNQINSTLQLAKLNMPGTDDAVLIEVAEQTLRKDSLVFRQRDSMPDASWESYLAQVDKQLIDQPSAFGWWLKAGLQVVLDQDGSAAAREAVALAPESGAAYAKLGAVLTASRGSTVEECKEACLRSIALNPEIAEAHYMLGLVYAHQKDYLKAAEYYKEALRHDSQYLEAYKSLGKAYWNEGQLESAVDAFQKVIQLNPDEQSAHECLGNIYNSLRRFDDAIIEFNELLHLDPNNEGAHRGLGYSYNELGRYQEAINECQEAILLDPDVATSHNNLGYAYNALARYRDALDSFEEAIRLEPEISNAYNGMGNAYSGLERPDDAIRCWEKALSLEPTYAVPLVSIAWIYINQGKQSIAIETLNRALQINPELPDAHYAMGITEFKRRHYDEAIIAYKEAIRLNPEYAAAYCELGKVYFKKRSMTLAREAFQNAMQYSNPGEWPYDHSENWLRNI